MAHHLAQLNLARPREPLDSPLLAGFMAALDAVNARADASPGFVWRMQTEDGNNTAVRGFGDDDLIVNLSVWEDIGALRAFVYADRAHLDVMRRRREWFAAMRSYLVLWWVPAGHVPTVAEAEERLALLEREGVTPEAFTFRRAFPPPGGDGAPVDDDRELCPA